MSDNQQVQTDQPVTPPSSDAQEPVSTEPSKPDSTISALPTDNPAPVPEPVSDVLAPSSAAPIEPTSTISAASSTQSANSTTISSDSNRPESNDSADSLIQSSPPVEEPASSDPVDSPSEPNLPTSSTDTIPSPIPPPVVPVDSSVVVSEASPSSNLNTPSDSSNIPISNTLLSDHVSQVPPAPPDSTSSEFLGQTENPKVPEPVSEPKPLEQPAIPSISLSDSTTPAPNTTFGDLLSPQPPPSPISPASPPAISPPTINDKPSTSFGDLLNQTTTSEPSINIEPIEPPAPPTISSSPNPQPQTPSPISPTINQSDLQKQLDEKIKSELDIRRQKANQVRAVKHQKILRLPQSTLYDDFHLLVKRGILKQVGKDRGTYYTL